jgi:SecD/SecF fusion protein
MKNKVFVQVITVLLLLASVYQMSFTLVTRSVEKKAEAVASQRFPADSVEARQAFVKHYLDSMRPMTVYNFGIGGFTYQECIERELNLGLELQGGLNVTLEVSTPDIIRKMAGNTKNQAFLEALDKAEKNYEGQRNFVDLLAETYREIEPEGKVAPIFYTRELDDYLPNKFNSTNEEVYEYLKLELNSAIGRAFEIISTRIDKFGVAQPNIQRLDNGRILVELPGVDDPSRVRKILQGAAELEFWYVYPPNDAYTYLTEINKIIAGQNALNGDDSTSGAASLTPSTASTSTNPSFTSSEEPEISEDTSNTEDSLSRDTGKEDTGLSALAANDQKSDEQLAAENPLFSKFSPNIDRERNIWNPGGFIGYVSKNDQKQFEVWFNLPEVKAIIPPDVHFRWSFNQVDEAGLVLALYALKSNRN